MMSTSVNVYCRNKTTKKLVLDEVLSDLIDNAYNDSNLSISFNIGDIIRVDGGRRGYKDDFLYEVNKRTHYIDKKGAYGLMLDLIVLR